MTQWGNDSGFAADTGGGDSGFAADTGMQVNTKEKEVYVDPGVPAMQDEVITKEKEVYVDPGMQETVAHAIAEQTTQDDPNFKAMVARAAYGESWRKAGYSDRGDLRGTDSRYLVALSDDRRAVWYNGTLDHVTIAYRGTDFGNAAGGRTQDLLTDVGIALNFTQLTPMYQRDAAHFKRVTQAFPTATVEVVGHSLGGHRARTIGRNFGVPSFGVNEGATPIASLPTLVDRAWCALFPRARRCQHTAVRVGYDPISVSSFLSSDTETRAYPEDRTYSLLDPHTSAMSQVFPLDSRLMNCDANGANCI